MNQPIANPESKIENPPSVLVTVTMRKDTYHARAGDGFFKSRSATSDQCGPFAAQAAAAKFLRVPEEQIVLKKHAPGVFNATVKTEEGAK